MNVKCSFCQTPYAIGRIEKLDALQHLYANNLNHYDAHCPRCRKATPVLRQKLEMTMPNWREALKQLETELASQQAAPQTQDEPATPPSAPVNAEAAPAPAKKAAKPKAESAKKTTKKSQ